MIYQSPLYYVKGVKTGKGLPKNVLSIEEMGKLLDNFSLIRKTDIMTYSLAELLYGSAMRVNEAAALKESDVDFDSAVITITDFKNGGLRWKSPTSEASIRALRRYVKTVRSELTTEKDRAEGFLYPQQGKTAIRCILNAKLKRECERLGLKTITSHSFRASAATHLLRSGAGIREIQAFLGHQKIGTTEVYTRVVKEDLKAVIETCHPRERRS
nr:tyrosine-type recombinase/integrase [Spirochaeta isovalerica]